MVRESVSDKVILRSKGIWEPGGNIMDREIGKYRSIDPGESSVHSNSEVSKRNSER